VGKQRKEKSEKRDQIIRDNGKEGESIRMSRMG
jgi:hypothetical protein